MSLTILQGNCLDVLPTLEAGSVQCVITSPPYYGLRDYQTPPLEWPTVDYAPMPGLPPLHVPGCDPSCEHEWGSVLRKGISGGTASAKVQVKGAENFQIVPNGKHEYCQRCGGWRGSLGLEPSPEIYVAHLVFVWRELWRLLRSDGVGWLNIADSYAHSTDKMPAHNGAQFKRAAKQYHTDMPTVKRNHGLKAKDLMLIPARVALALQADGWTVRSDVIWAKGRDGDIEEIGPGNVMPESVEDRVTRSHEYVFMLSKQPRYYFDAEAIKERAIKGAAGSTFTNGKTGVNGLVRVSQQERVEDGSRNARSVWFINTAVYKGSHYAVFPERLVEKCLLAGSSPMACGARLPGGVVCGAPWKRVVERTVTGERHISPKDNNPDRNDGGDVPSSRLHSQYFDYKVNTLGWAPTCTHDEPTGQSVVLDPFAGSGTTLRVAMKHGRSAIGIELNPAYIEEQIEARTNGVQMSMESHL